MLLKFSCCLDLLLHNTDESSVLRQDLILDGVLNYFGFRICVGKLLVSCNLEKC